MSMFQRPRNPAARLSAKARRSQSWWKTGSFGSGSTGPKPCMPPRSWMPFIVIGSPRTAGPQPREISMVALPSPRRLHLGDADHRVARDEIRQLLLGHAFRAPRALGQHEIAQLRDGGGGVGEQTLLERRIDPGLRDDAGTVARTDLRLVGVDQRVERLRVDEPLVHQQ